MFNKEEYDTIVSECKKSRKFDTQNPSQTSNGLIFL